VRHYDPTSGRFISPDPFKGYMDEPASQHPYMYCHGNPINYSDPDGYEPQPPGDRNPNWKSTPYEREAANKGLRIVIAASVATMVVASSGGTATPAVATFTYSLAGGGTLTITATDVVVIGGALIGNIFLHHQNDNTTVMFRGGKQNKKQNDFYGKSNEALDKIWKEIEEKTKRTKADKALKRKLETEYKARKLRNPDKRLENY
jgi:hypothetical protein